MQSYHQLRSQAIRFIREFSGTGPILVLASQRAAADEVALEACTEALWGVQRLGFREFVIELSAAELNRRGLLPIGRLIREALAARVTAAALDRGELGYLEPVARFPGFPRALTTTFEELRLNAVDLEALRDCGESGPDLALLLAAYRRELSDRRMADHATRVELALDTLSSSYNRLRQTALVAFDLSPRTRQEIQLLDGVAAASPKALILQLAPDDVEPATSLASLQRYLFSREPVPQRPEDGSLAIFSTSGESLECVEIARAIHNAAAEGVAFDEIAVLLRSPERHQPLLLEALRRAGIPYLCTLSTRRPDVAGRSLLALLHCAAEGLSASRFAEYLSLGQMPGDEEPPTPALWERLIVDAAVIGGLSRWEARLAGLRQEFHRRHAAEPDELDRESLARRIESLERLERLALPVIARLDQLPRKARWGDWLDAIGSLAETTVADPDRVLALLDELEPMSDIGPVELSEVLLVLAPRLNALASPSTESRFGKVWIGAIEEARGLSFRLVFVPGVNEGLFPRPPAEDPLLLHAQRKDLEIKLRAEDNELLGIAVACASERLTISFSRLDLLTGRERVPSFYVFEAHRAAGGTEMGVREFELRARSQTSPRIGWPAPADPMQAIDDAEFDLATLSPLEPGSGRYLQQLRGRSVDSLRARWSRWRKSWKPSDGLVIEEIGSDALSEYRLTKRAWSPSGLQQFARCPYRFALHGIHGLRPAEQPSGIQRMSPATRGNIFHAVQFELLREGGFTDAFERLDGVVARVAARYRDELAPAIPHIWDAEIQTLKADLRGWLQNHASLAADWTPQFAELSFGLRDPVGRDPHSVREPVEIEGGFLLQGSIDLVERHSSGALRVVDHKTGRIPDPRPELVGGGEALQPVLYALAAGKILNEQVDQGRLSYATIAQNYANLDVLINDWTRQRALAVLRIIDEAMDRGFLPAAPRKDGCKHCEYIPVCGPYEEERVALKSQPELKTIKELRSWR